MKLIKKFLPILIVLSLMLAALSGCGAQSAPDESPAAADSEGNISYEIPERGLVLKIAQEYLDKGVEVERYNENLKGYLDVFVYYYAPSADQYFDEMYELSQSGDATQEQLDDCMYKIWDVSRELMEISMVETDEYNELVKNGAVPEDFTYYGNSEVLGENDGYTYIVSIPELDNGALNEQEIAQYLECRAYMQTVKENIGFTKVVLESSETNVGSVMPEFTAKDINGNTVDNSIFEGKDLTVVNIWGTFCAPCISEMPELAEWAEEMPENVQLIGIVGDIDGEDDTKHLELARKIAEKAGVEFTNIIANEDFGSLMRGIIGYPTTIFVDGSGNIIGESIVGADMDCYKTTVEALLNGSMA